MHPEVRAIRSSGLRFSSMCGTCIRRMPKTLRFALIGALGCLAGAIAGEGLLAGTKSADNSNIAMGPRSICLVIDTSGSMKRGKLAQVQAAAKNFVYRQDLSRTRLAVVSFATDAKLAASLTSDPVGIEGAIDHLNADGWTAINLGLQAAEHALRGAPSPRHILLFTDGQATSPTLALAAARTIRHRGIHIVAIGTGDADRTFLAEITADPSLVLWAEAGEFEDAFRAAERLIAGASLVDASSGYSLAYGLGRTGGWTALLAVGLGPALIGAQNRYLRRPLLTRRDALIGGGGCIAAGLLAGGVGQSLFALTRSDVAASAFGPMLLGAALGRLGGRVAGLSPKRAWLMLGIGAGAGALIAIGSRWLCSKLTAWYWLPTVLSFPAWAAICVILLMIAGRLGRRRFDGREYRIAAMAGVVGPILLLLIETYVGEAAMLLTDATTRLIGWSILGSLLGLGLSLFIPNLNRRHALVAGAASGVAGALLYLTVGAYLGGGVSRLIGALALGFAMGLMLVVAEVACREHWLEVAYAPNDRRTINLGPQAVTIGAAASHDSNGRPNAAEALTYRVDQDAILCQDASTGRICRVAPGQTSIIDGAQVTVRSRGS